MTVRIFDSRTNESVIIVTNAKASRIRELVSIKGSFKTIIKGFQETLRTEGYGCKCVFDSDTDNEEIATAIGWSWGIDTREELEETFEKEKNRLFELFTEAITDSNLTVIDGDNDSMIIRGEYDSNGRKYELDFLVKIEEA